MGSNSQENVNAPYWVILPGEVLFYVLMSYYGRFRTWLYFFLSWVLLGQWTITFPLKLFSILLVCLFLGMKSYFSSTLVVACLFKATLTLSFMKPIIIPSCLIYFKIVEPLTHSNDGLKTCFLVLRYAVCNNYSQVTMIIRVK